MRALVAIALITGVLLPACGERGESTGPSEELDGTLLQMAQRIEGGFVPAPCGSDAADSARLVCDVVYDYLYREAGPNVPVLPPADPDRRRQAARIVSRAVPALRRVAACQDASARGECATTLAELAWVGYHHAPRLPAAWDLIRAALSDELGALSSLVRDQDPSVASEALEAVLAIAPKSPTAWALVRSALAGRTAMSTADVALVMQLPERDSQHFLPLLLESLLTRPPSEGDVRLWAIQPITSEPSTELAEQLRRALRSDNGSIRRAALEAVSSAHGVSFLTPVVLIFDGDTRLQMRFSAAIALGSMGEGAAEALPSLLSAFRSDGDLLRGVVLQALTKMGVRSEVAVSALLEALTTLSADDRRFLLRLVDALAVTGVGSDRAAAKLRELSKDMDPKVARRAEAGLRLAAGE